MKQYDEARLLSVEETKEYVRKGYPFFLEYVGGLWGWTIPFWGNESWFYHGDCRTPKMDEYYIHYNEKFRAWTSPPTREQAQAEKWIVREYYGWNDTMGKDIMEG